MYHQPGLVHVNESAVRPLAQRIPVDALVLVVHLADGDGLRRVPLIDERGGVTLAHDRLTEEVKAVHLVWGVWLVRREKGEGREVPTVVDEEDVRLLVC